MLGTWGVRKGEDQERWEGVSRKMVEFKRTLGGRGRGGLT